MPDLIGKNILVTGGAGFIGSHLVDLLIHESPNRLVVVDNLFLGREDNLINAFTNFTNLKFYKEDASNYNTMKRIITENKITIVFNLAVIPLPKSLEEPGWTIEENVSLTTTLCELCRKGYFKTLIQFSSSEVYGTAIEVPMSEKHSLLPLTPYAASKAAADHIVISYYKTFGLDVAIVRPFNNFGPRQNDRSYAGVIPMVINNILSGRPIEIFGDGFQSRDFIFVKDTAIAAINICKEERTRGKIINIASGKETTINDLVNIILELIQKKNCKVVHVSPRKGDVRRHCADITLANELIGFKPAIDVYEGLEETVKWYIQRKQ